MMGEFPNPATQFKKGSTKAVQCGKKGGETKSVNRNIGQRLRWMRKKGMSKEQVDWIAVCLNDPEASILDIKDYMEKIKEDLHPAQRVALMNSMISLHKARHGEKIKTENVHHVINWTDNLKECEIEDGKKFTKISKEDV